MKRIIPTKIREAGKITIGGAESQAVLNSQGRQMRIRHQIRTSEGVGQ